MLVFYGLVFVCGEDGLCFVDEGQNLNVYIGFLMDSTGI